MTEENEMPTTRSEVINTFGEELGRRLIDAGLPTLTSIFMIDESYLSEVGFTDEEIETIKAAVPEESLEGEPVQPKDEAENFEDAEEAEIEAEEEFVEEETEGGGPVEDAEEESVEGETEEGWPVEEAAEEAQEEDEGMGEGREADAEMLAEVKMDDLREQAKEYGITEYYRRKDDLIEAILDAVYPEPEVLAAKMEPELNLKDEEPPASVRVQRIRDAQSG